MLLVVLWLGCDDAGVAELAVFGLVMAACHLRGCPEQS